MKQIKAAVLFLAICLIFTSCSSNQSASSSGAASQAVSSAIASGTESGQPATDVSEGKSTIPGDMKFDFTFEKFLQDLNSQLESGGNAQIETKPQETKVLKYEKLGEATCNYYPIADGVYLGLSYDKADNKMMEAALICERANTTETGTKQYKTCIGIIENKMARSEAETVDKKLNTDNVKESASEIAFTDETAFYYEVTDDELSFYVVTEEFLSSFQDDTSSSAASSPSKKEFDFGIDRFVDTINKDLAKNKLGALPKPSKTESDFPGFGKADCYEYAAGDGVELVIYADQDNSNVVSIQYLVDTAKTTDQSMNYYQQCAGKTLVYLDMEEAQSVVEKLDLDNISKDRVASATSSHCSYSFIISEGRLSLLIDPNVL
jgi:hypothetical protein